MITTMSDNGYGYFYCRADGHIFDEQDQHSLNNDKHAICPLCRQTMHVGDEALGVEVSRYHLGMYADPTRVLGMTWFHRLLVAPGDFRYEQNYFRPGTHVGTLRTVEEWTRCHVLPHESTYLTTFTIRPEAKVHPEIMDDFDDWSEAEDMLRQEDGPDVILYVNRYEGTGDISLLVNPAMLSPVDFEFTPARQEKAA